MSNLGSLNPPQREAVEIINGPVLILAGAGTGKTRVITFRISHMISKGVAPENILAVTFTNKAAREMQERVNKLLPNLKFKAQNGEPLKRPTICTFHSLCVRILRQQIERLGYKRNFVIYDESEQLGAVKKILCSISAGGEKTDPGAILALLSKFKNGGEHFRERRKDRSRRGAGDVEQIQERRRTLDGIRGSERPHAGRAHPHALRIRLARLQCRRFR